VTPKVTVSVGSSRPGGIDILLASLKAQTFTDFEVVFTDQRYHKRHAQVLDAVEAVGLTVPFFHVPNQRNSPGWVSSCAGVNTGFMLSAGEIVIMLLDYAYCPPGWIEAHLKHHVDRRRVVMSPHIYHALPEVVTKDGRPPTRFTNGGAESTVEAIEQQRENFYETTIFRQPFRPSVFAEMPQYVPPHQDPKLYRPEGIANWDVMHTKNESFRREDVLAIGGIDENFDRGGGPGDLLFGCQLVSIGCEPWICQEAAVHVLDPRPILPSTRVAGHGREWVAAGLGKWSYTEGETYWRERMGEKTHVSRNPYDMREKRKELWHWRDLSQQREPVIPYIEKTDAEYFGLVKK